MKTPKTRALRRKGLAGFSMIEAIIGIAVMGIAMLGLAQVFLLGVANNRRAGEISSASFLAQQEIDYLRSLTADELNTFPATGRGESADEIIDSNRDGTPDFRRVTQITQGDLTYTIKIFVFSAARAGVPLASLTADPWGNKVRAMINTVIGR